MNLSQFSLYFSSYMLSSASANLLFVLSAARFIMCPMLTGLSSIVSLTGSFSSFISFRFRKLLSPTCLSKSTASTFLPSSFCWLIWSLMLLSMQENFMPLML